jgi:hypothetical protein
VWKINGAVNLEVAFWYFYRFRKNRFGFSTTSGDWNDALKQLDGTFIPTHRQGESILASFHNPSIRDFLEDFLSNSEGDVVDLISRFHTWPSPNASRLLLIEKIFFSAVWPCGAARHPPAC